VSLCQFILHCFLFVLQDGQYDIPKPFHFFPKELYHMISVIYPESISDSKLGRHVRGLVSVTAVVDVFL